MGNRLTRLYTRTGDDGTTGLGDGSRLDKSALRIGVIGDVDELNSLLGVLLAQALPVDVRELIEGVQHILFDIGAELSLPGEMFLQETRGNELEQTIDRYNKALPPLKEFILPGGDMPAALSHLARAVCRRAERQLVALSRQEVINQHTLIYLNRLSDLLFVIARILARHGGRKEVYWKKDWPGGTDPVA